MQQSCLSPAAPAFAQLLHRAQLALRAGNAAAAAQCLKLILAQSPAHPEAAHSLALLAHDSGNLPEALHYFRIAASAPAAPARYAANLAEICRLQGLLAEGEAAGRQAVARDPALAAGWNNLGIILQESGQYAESRTCLACVLQLQPENPEAHNNLGNTLQRLGLAEAAEQHWRRAIALRPAYAQPHANLCAHLSERRAYAEAEAHGMQALALAPNLADAYVNLAGLETARQNHAAALLWADRLLQLAPTHAVGLAARAAILAKLHRIPEAEHAAAAAIAAAPHNADAHLAHGNVLRERGRTEEALAAFSRAAALPGTAAEQALTNRALLFMEQGDTATAEAEFTAALKTYPNSASLWFNRADLHKFTATSPEIPAMQALLSAPEAAGPNDQMLLHFALGKAYLDCQNGPQAFHHLDLGNRLKRESFSYDPATAIRLVDQTCRAFTPETLGAAPGPPDPRPIFIVGMPRSGTTLLEQILASHPAIFGAGELAHLQQLSANLQATAQPTLTDADLHGLGQAYLAHINLLAPEKTHIIDKMPANFIHCGLIRLILPQARIIHIRRNAVDTCFSCYSKLFSGEQLFAYDQTELGLFYKQYDRVMSHWRALLPPSHFIELHYEDLVADMESQTRRLLNFLGLAWHDSCRTFFTTPRPVRTASLNQVRQPLYATATNRWRPYAQHLHPLLQALGM